MPHSLTSLHVFDISWINRSKRDHRAAVHWGAVTFVGSVRMRDLYRVADGGPLPPESRRKHEMYVQ